MRRERKEGATDAYRIACAVPIGTDTAVARPVSTKPDSIRPVRSHRARTAVVVSGIVLVHGAVADSAEDADEREHEHAEQDQYKEGGADYWDEGGRQEQ